MAYEGGEGEVPIRAPDISLHGMFLNTTTHFPEGAVVNLRFRLTRSNIEVQTRGEVRYCLHGIGIGVEFLGIGVEALGAIEQEIQASFSASPPKTERNSRIVHREAQVRQGTSGKSVHLPKSAYDSGAIDGYAYRATAAEP